MALAATLVPAAAAQADNSFEGTCDPIQGNAKFDTPLSNTAGDNTYHFTGTGTCKGKLNGADVSDAPIEAQVDGAFNGSCSGSKSTAPGPGHLTFTKGTPSKTDDVTVTFTMTFTGTASEVDFVLKGDKSGEATGHASFLTQRTPPDILIKCGSDGNSELPFDANSTTSSPLTSASGPAPSGGGQPSGGGGGGGGGQPSGGGGDSAPAPSGQEASGSPQSGGKASIVVQDQKLADVRKHGLHVTCVGPAGANCVLKAAIPRSWAKRLKLRSQTIGSGRATTNSDGMADVVIRLTGNARKRLAKAKASVPVSVTGKVKGEKVTAAAKLTR